MRISVIPTGAGIRGSCDGPGGSCKWFGTVHVRPWTLQALTSSSRLSSTALDSEDQSEGRPFGVSFHGRPSFQSLDSVESYTNQNPQIPMLAQVSDSQSKSSTSQRWRDTAPYSSDSRESSSSLVESSFDAFFPTSGRLRVLDKKESANGHTNHFTTSLKYPIVLSKQVTHISPWRDTAPSLLLDGRGLWPSFFEPSFEEHVRRALCGPVVIFPCLTFYITFSDLILSVWGYLSWSN